MVVGFAENSEPVACCVFELSWSSLAFGLHSFRFLVCIPLYTSSTGHRQEHETHRQYHIDPGPPNTPAVCLGHEATIPGACPSFLLTSPGEAGDATARPLPASYPPQPPIIQGASLASPHSLFLSPCPSLLPGWEAGPPEPDHLPVSVEMLVHSGLLRVLAVAAEVDGEEQDLGRITAQQRSSAHRLSSC